MRSVFAWALAGAALLAMPAAAETRILAFGDSNTWGWVPVVEGFPTQRLADAERWAGILDAELGPEVTVVVDGLVGRTTNIDRQSPLGAVPAGGFNGAAALGTAIAQQAPVDLVVIMLGTNDLQAGVERSPEAVAEAVLDLVGIVSASVDPVFTSYPAPAVLVVAPPAYGDTSATPLSGLFAAGEGPSQRLGAAFRSTLEAAGVALFDASEAIGDVDGADGIHMTAEEHMALGKALAAPVRALIEDREKP